MYPYSIDLKLHADGLNSVSQFWVFQPLNPLCTVLLRIRIVDVILLRVRWLKYYYGCHLRKSCALSMSTNGTWVKISVSLSLFCLLRSTFYFCFWYDCYDLLLLFSKLTKVEEKQISLLPTITADTHKKKLSLPVLQHEICVTKHIAF